MTRVSTKRSLAFWMAAAAVAVLTLAVAPRPARASLGGDETTVQADQTRMAATLRTTTRELYTIHEMQASNNVVVREFVSQAGKVFGVAWQGPTRPDLSHVLGAYFDTFTKAAQKMGRAARGPLSIQQPGLVVQLGGHARSFVGMAYVPQMLPAGVSPQEIQ